jgi:hypothetical protein
LSETQVGYGWVNPSPEKKAWGQTTIDAINEHFLIANFRQGEIYTERGDSGGPWSLAGMLTASAYPTGWDARGINFFVSGAHNGLSDGIPPNNGDQILGARIDQRGFADNNLDFLKQGLPMPQVGKVNILHNLNPNPASLPPNTPQGILLSAFYGPGQDYLFDPVLWEDDSFLSYDFEGVMKFGASTFWDDLTGFGYAAGTLPTGASWVYAWDITTAGALAMLAEPGNIFDPPLDWMLKINPSFDLTNDILPVSYADLLLGINTAKLNIALGEGIRAPFYMYDVPEPSSFILIITGLFLGTIVNIRRKIKS